MAYAASKQRSRLLEAKQVARQERNADAPKLDLKAGLVVRPGACSQLVDDLGGQYGLVFGEIAQGEKAVTR